MLISYKWLKSYVPDLPQADKLSDIFTFHLCEVEGIEKTSDDTVFDLNILPDRAHDLLSCRGIAKDLAGILNIEYKNIEYKIPIGEDTNLSIKVESENCRRYMGRIIKNIQVSSSSDWMRNYLLSMGQRSINNLVDATNIVMFDRGNPIHVFDLDKVEGNIIIRQAKEGEKMITLDNKEVKLCPSNMVITDEKNILAIAGVKGGKVAEVDENTKNIIIEVANFDPTSVRKTSKEVNIFTDAVKRFENDLSPETANNAMNDVSALVLEMCKSAVLEKVVDIYPKKQEKRELSFNVKKISKRLGLNISVATVEDILKHYGVEYKNDGNDFKIIVPDTRLDLKIEEDMSEEIIRILGYKKLEEKLPEIKWSPKTNEIYSKMLWARNKLLNDGYSEVMTYTFCNKGEVEVLASASDKKFLRTNLSDGLLDSVAFNSTILPLLGIQKFKDLKIFEIGTVFLKSGEEVRVAYNEEEKIIEETLENFCKNIPSNFFLEPRNYNLEAKFKMWSLFPFIARDIAVWVPEEVESNQVYKVIKENAGDMVMRGPELFDQFKKPASTQGGDGKISYAFRLVFQSYDRTLTDTEINEIMTKITNKIKEKNGWQVR
jgi:phenylalanyl-tRNA synthetase beta chain